MSDSGDDVVNTVASGGTLGHNTTAIKRYEVPSANFTLLDMWGLDRNNYKAEHKVLPALLDGWLPGNWKMEASVRDNRHRLADNNASRNTRRVHGVLFFVIASAVHDDQEMETLKVSFQKVSLAYMSSCAMATNNLIATQLVPCSGNTDVGILICLSKPPAVTPYSLKTSMALHLHTCLKCKGKKYYTFQRQFDEKPGFIPGWPYMF